MKRNIARSSLTGLALTVVFTLAGFGLHTYAKGAKPPPPPPSPTHRYVPLGTFGGQSAYAMAVNQLGQVAGSATLDMASNLRHAFLVVPEDTSGDGLPDRWFRDDDGNAVNDLMVDLGTAVGFEASFATDLNDAGQVLVYCYSESQTYIPPQAFIVTPADLNGDGKLEWFWQDASGANALMIRLEFGPALAVTDSQAKGINRAGQVVGNYNNGRGFLITPLDPDGNGVADTWYQNVNSDGINDLLTDLGTAVSQAGILEPIQPSQINDAGQIVGMVPNRGQWGDPCILTPKSDASGARVWNADANQDGANDLVIKLPVLAAGMWGCANGVNSAGVVVGWSQTKASNPHAMMWRVDAQGRVTTTDLGIMPGEAQSIASAVNDSLQVVGYGTTYYMRKMQITQSAFLWQNGVMRDLRDFLDQGALLAGRRMVAFGMNNPGMIIGYAYGDAGQYPFIAVPIR